MGVNDTALSVEMAEQSLKYCQDGRLEKFPEATHWLQHEEAEAVNNKMLSFFMSNGEA